MTTLLLTALIMGAIGSTHCIGMCGPIAFALPVVSNSNLSKFTGSLLYNIGRVITYAFLGLIMGLIGKTFVLFGFQQALSLFLGVCIIIFIFVPANFRLIKTPNPVSAFYFNIRKRIGNLFTQKNYSAVLFIGLLNGLLPCGLVYMAIAGAIATSDPFKSSLFMVAFGLGTLPLMWAVAFFGSFINLHTRRIINKTYPFIMGLVACMLILRGLGLDIPYISPALHESQSQATIECHK